MKNKISYIIKYNPVITIDKIFQLRLRLPNHLLILVL